MTPSTKSKNHRALNKWPAILPGITSRKSPTNEIIGDGPRISSPITTFTNLSGKGLLKIRFLRGTVFVTRPMKRLTLIVCCFLILFAGVAAAWASCREIPFATAVQLHARSAPVHTHKHHSEPAHQHSHNSVIHCPPLDEFVPTAIFSVGNDHRVERIWVTVTGELASQFTPDRFHLIHGPPGFSQLSLIPSYLLLSVLRI